MSRGVRWFLMGSRVLVTLAGCGRGIMQYAGERAPWRHEAEVACLNSGTVKESAGLVRISPIEGPGMCGADFPLKVSALGESPALGYVDEPIRPPGSIAGGGRPAAEPRWPISQQQPIRRRARVAAARRADVDRGARRGASRISAAADARRAAVQSAGAAGLAARRTVSRTTTAGAARRAAAADRPKPIEVDELPPYARPGAAPVGPPQTARRAAAAAAARPAARSAACRRNPDRDQAGGDAGLPDRVGARPLVRQRGAAGGAQVVQPAGGRDQADLGLFVPRHERPGRREHFRACLRQCARHRGLRAGRRPPHHRQGRLEGLAGGAGLSARRAGLGLRPVHHGAGAGLQPVPLRPHPRRSDAAGERPAHLPAGRGGRRGGRLARPRQHRATRRGRSSRRRRAATIRRSSRTAIRSPGAATPAAAIRPPPARLPRGGPGSRTRRPTTSTGSRSRARARRSTGAQTSTRFIERLRTRLRNEVVSRVSRLRTWTARRRDQCVSRDNEP